MTVCTFDLTGPYVYDENVVVLWVASIADAQAPTAAEIATGTSLQPSYNLTDIIGWETETEIIKGGKWGPQELQRLGEQSIPDAGFIFAAARDGNDIRTFWNRGEEGFIVFLPSGPYLDHPTALVDVFPVTVAQLTQRKALRLPSSQIMVSFAIRERCGENVTIV